jgi:hypothetical protein
MIISAPAVNRINRSARNGHQGDIDQQDKQSNCQFAHFRFCPVIINGRRLLGWGLIEIRLTVHFQ